MNLIFISYRRDDGIDTAQLLQRDLQIMFGDDAVFLDINTMKAGDEFPVELQNAVCNSIIVIIMIGKNWKGIDPQINRLMQEGDWVRKELEIALGDNKKKIFPVFVKGATLSNSFKDLPPSLERLTKFNGIELREKEFKYDLLQLIPVIEPYIPLNDPLKNLPIDENKYRFPPGSPFKGLDYFTEKDTRLFFGRGTEIRKLYNKIRNNDLVMLFGQSGSGKSSLLFAGLKPRLEFKGWTVYYVRREAGVNLAEKLDEYLLSSTTSSNLLVILDQVEEVFTNPSKTLSSDAELQQLLSSVIGVVDKNIRILLSFRKEYLAEIEKGFTDLLFEKTYLEPLQTKGVLDAIRGITLSDEAQDNYELRFSDSSVPMAIAQTVLSDEESHVAPLLQVLLRKMWDIVEKSKPRIFSKELLEEVKSKNLVSLLNDQIAAMKEKFPAEVENGLVLDVLYFFTTPRGTSAARTSDELAAKYDHEDIYKVVTELKNKYLLSEPSEETKNITRLAHDALAPLIRELYAQSNLTGQRASRLLESKKQDIETGSDVEFSRPDLAIIDEGKEGMRKLTEAETNVIEQSRRRIQQHELELEEKNKQLEAALEEAKEQTLQARAKALSATSRQMMQKNDSTMALRLAEAACKTTPEPTNEAKSAFFDITKSNNVYYKKLVLSSDEILATAFSPDGKWILTGCEDNTARLWSLDGKLKQIFEGHQNSVESVAFSPDGKYILTSGRKDYTARLWSFDGTLNGTLKHVHNKRWDLVSSVAFSPDGKFIVTVSMKNIVWLWLYDGTMAKVINLQKKSGTYGRNLIRSVAFSPDGQHILTSSENSARLWSLDGRLKRSFRWYLFGINTVAFSPDGKYILTGGYSTQLWALNRTCGLWLLSKRLKQSFKGHQNGVTSVAFSPNGKFILTGSRDKTVRLWSLDGKLKQTFEVKQGEVKFVAFSPDGKFILVVGSDNTARLWSLDRITRLWSMDRTGWLSPFGKMKQAFTSKDSVKKYVREVIFSPDREFILCSTYAGTTLWSLDGILKKTFRGRKGGDVSAAFSPDGKCILIGYLYGKVRLWSLSGRLKQVFKVKGWQGDISSVAFSSNGKYILASCYDYRTWLWSLDGKLKQTFEGPNNGFEELVFSPDRKSRITGIRNKSVRLWSFDGKLKQTFEGHQDLICCVAFSPDGKFILTGSDDKTARLWSLNGKLRRVFKGHQDSILCVAFSPDGKYILTGGHDNTARLWSLDGKLKQIFEGHAGSVRYVAFSPDGKLIITVSDDKIVQLWLPLWELINPENTYVPSPEQMKEYDIPEDMEWGKVW